MARVFRRYIPMLYGVAAYFGCFACVQAGTITHIFGGAEFAGASLPVAIMALYPIHQTYGQLNIGLLFMIAGLPVAYFMVAPSAQMGIGAGAIGLAVKFVALQFIVVNVQLWFNARFLNFQFSRYLTHQVACMACLLVLALLSMNIVDAIPILKGQIIPGFLFSGVLYTFFVGITTAVIPALFGLHRQDINRIIAKISGA